MRTWVYSPHAGGKSILFPVKIRTERRVLDLAAKHYPGRFSRIDVRSRGTLCYIDVYSEPDMPRGIAPPPGETRDQWFDRLGSTPTHLCRIRYFGNEDRWSFAWYTYAHEKYEPSFLLRIPAMPITRSNLMAIRIPIDADHHRSEATLDCTYHR
jgi:hypothetical protein